MNENLDSEYNCQTGLFEKIRYFLDRLKYHDRFFDILVRVGLKLDIFGCMYLIFVVLVSHLLCLFVLQESIMIKKTCFLHSDGDYYPAWI